VAGAEHRAHPEARVAEVRQDRRQIAGADALLQSVPLLLRDVAGGDRLIDARDRRALERVLQVVLVQGVGDVGGRLAEQLAEADARLRPPKGSRRV
jgi:hypothetical protein